jgi:hypothetical protein
MQFPNWLKTIWWALLVVLLSAFLKARLPELIDGKATAGDIAVFAILMALLLAPLFTEVALLGVTLKREIEELKSSVSAQLLEVRSDIRNAVDIKATVSPTFNIPPPPDAQLPAIEARVKEAVAAVLAEHGQTTMLRATAQLTVSDDVAFLFATRYHIESELRRIAEARELPLKARRVVPIHQVARHLIETESLSPRLAGAVQEVFSVCSPAIHGEPVSDAQVAFVRDVAPELVSALRAIR